MAQIEKVGNRGGITASAAFLAAVKAICEGLAIPEADREEILRKAEIERALSGASIQEIEKALREQYAEPAVAA